jgi:disulfide bond formation protein DsbB
MRWLRVIGPVGLLAAHLEILILCSVLLGAMTVQFVGRELPCPLCILQRLAMMLAAIGAAFIIRSARGGELTLAEFATGHGMILLAGLGGAAISARQVLLHIVPPDPGYGGVVLGLHLYTWALVVFLCLIGSTAVCLLFARWFTDGTAKFGWWSSVTVGLLGIVILANTVAIFFEQGFHWKLPDDPVRYELLHGS